MVNDYKKQAEENKRFIEQDLLKTVWVEEAKNIPKEALSTTELDIVNKCIMKADMSKDEITYLKKILQQYRSAIEEYQPNEAIENYETIVTMINTEKELIDIFDNNHNTLLVHLPFNGKTYGLEFTILPLTDSRAVQSIQAHVDIFQDYSTDKIQLFRDAQTGKQLTREQQLIVEKMNKEINEKATQNRMEIIDDLLVNQLRLPNSSDDEKVRREFWSKFPFNAKVSVFAQIEDNLGLTEYSNEQLFPAL